MGIILVNRHMQALAKISWQKAARLIAGSEIDSKNRLNVSGFGDVVKTVSSANHTFNIHEIIMIYSRDDYLGSILHKGNIRVTHRRILERDNHLCAYCGEKATTVDHIIPKSRGGGNTWDNLIAACFPCNNFKDNRTPLEAGMDLMFMPTPLSSPQENLQAQLEDIVSQRHIQDLEDILRAHSG